MENKKALWFLIFGIVLVILNATILNIEWWIIILILTSPFLVCFVCIIILLNYLASIIVYDFLSDIYRLFTDRGRNGK